MAEVERKMLGKALDRTSENRHAAAKLLGIEMAALERKLVEHGIGGRRERRESDGQ